jgi:phosphoglycolate phosphatase
MAARTGRGDPRTDFADAVVHAPLSVRYVASVTEPVILYLFDIDGTLLRARGSGSRAFDAVIAAQHGIAEACRGMRFGGKTDPALLDEVLIARRGHAATAGEREAFLLAYVPRLEVELGKRGVDVLPGAPEALHYLAALSDVRLGIATGNVRAGAELKLRRAQLDGCFGFGGYGCDSPRRAELVARAIERGRGHHEIRDVVVVGDTVHDIAAARACGAIACAVTTGNDGAEGLDGADVVWTSLHQLPAWHAVRFGAVAVSG